MPFYEEVGAGGIAGPVLESNRTVCEAPISAMGHDLGQAKAVARFAMRGLTDIQGHVGPIDNASLAETRDGLTRAGALLLGATEGTTNPNALTARQCAISMVGGGGEDGGTLGQVEVAQVAVNARLENLATALRIAFDIANDISGMVDSAITGPDSPVETLIAQRDLFSEQVRAYAATITQG